MIEANGRCRSWKPGARPHEPRHDPGRCRRCWVPCRNKVPRDGATVRCEECTEAILALHVPRLSRMLLEETYVPTLLSERLAADLDAGVALAARERIEATAVLSEPDQVQATAVLPEPDPDPDQVQAIAALPEPDSVEDLYSVPITAAPSDHGPGDAAVPGTPGQDDTNWSEVEW